MGWRHVSGGGKKKGRKEERKRGRDVKNMLEAG